MTSEDAYISLDGQNIVVSKEGEESRIPLHLIENIFYFGFKGASPALMGACCERGIRLSFMRPNGRFLAACSSENNGNVLLRKSQYKASEDRQQSVIIARNFIFGKIYNSRWVLERALRDHKDRIDCDCVSNASSFLQSSLPSCLASESCDTLRGLEGACSMRYFEAFDNLILRNKESFFFVARSRRPPLDNVNAMLSFCYSILANECASALSAVGLDPYVGFMHTIRPGRKSLALDLMEELRSVFADRFVVSAINNREITQGDFIAKENGAVAFTDDSRKKLIKLWQEKKKEQITHPYLGEKIEWGLVPYAQSMLLARRLRGDLDEYPPFLWK